MNHIGTTERPPSPLSTDPLFARFQMPHSRVKMILLALYTPTEGPSTLAGTEQTLWQAELMHKALIAQAGGGQAIDCPELTGRNVDGRPLQGHQHAHLLPLDLDADDRIDHMLIFSSMGLGTLAQQAIRNLKSIWSNSQNELHTIVVGQGTLNDLVKGSKEFDHPFTNLIGPARTWRSRTPLVLPRFCKVRGTNSLPGQVLAELACRGLPPAKVEALSWTQEPPQLRHMHRVRKPPAKAPPVDAGYAIRLIFENPVTGPISLGYASHFGLGSFMAEG